jgi:DNA-damage-inducible protein D
VECWSARDLQEVFGYAKWENFQNALEKAKESCKNAGQKPQDHFPDVRKMVELGSGSVREIDDVLLTRYAAYLVAQNGDPSKSEIAFAQSYFAIQTRKQELVEKRLLDAERLKAREKLSEGEKRLSGIIYERGVGEKDFAIIRSQGDKALFGGNSTGDMKRRLKVASSRPLADFLPTLTIKAKDFANELTSHNVVEKDLRGINPISQEHVDNNRAVRKMLLERGVRPESLPSAEDAKKVQRRLDGEAKSVLKGSKKKS